MQMSGRCLCGQVTYTADTELVFTSVCHCKVFQRQAGTAFATLIPVPKDAMTVTGEMKTYTETGGSGQPAYRRFCPECGSPILLEVAIMPDKMVITSGRLTTPASSSHP
jgi:hypothetical protein